MKQPGKFLILITLFMGLSAHELFLKTDNYFVKPNNPHELYLYNGTFTKSENAITRDRIISPQILGPNYKFIPRESDYYDADSATYLKFKSGSQGTYVAGISTLPRMIHMEAKEFYEYLEHEGLEDVIAMRKKLKLDNQSADEQYAKHVKSVFQVGKSTSDHYKTIFGYPVEFVPLVNPYELSIGDEIRFQLLVNGQPFGNQTVHFACTDDPSDLSYNETQMRTDAKGEVSFKITQAGQWYIATIHMVPSDKDGIDYVSNWATLTFGVR